MLLKLLQPSNRLFAMLLSVVGNSISVRRLQSLNAQLLIVVTLFGIVIFDKLLQPLNNLYVISVSLLGSSRLSSKMTSVRLLQFSNALDPIVATFCEIKILVKLLQFAKAELPMLVTLSGIVILVKPVQLSNAKFPMVVTTSLSFVMIPAAHPRINVFVLISIRQLLTT